MSGGLVLLVAASLISASFGQSSTGFEFSENGGYGCNVCGGTYAYRYSGGQLSHDFTDPTPAGSAASSISIVFNGLNCGNDPYIVTVYINGASVGTVDASNIQPDCNCGDCKTYPTFTFATPAGYVKESTRSHSPILTSCWLLTLTLPPFLFLAPFAEME